MGVLDRYQDFYSATPFARTFLSSQSRLNQLDTLAFEPRLVENWLKIEDAYRRGHRLPKPPKPEPEFRKHLHLFLEAMDEAALFRSKELWDTLGTLPECGRLLELGAGSGRYLTEFLERYPQWEAIFVDLDDVIESSGRRLQERYGKRIELIACDITAASMDEGVLPEADVILVSNLIHCYGMPAVRTILQRARGALAGHGILVVHDFFSDLSCEGALYDAHMLANTDFGQTHAAEEVLTVLSEMGLGCQRVIQLPSHSQAIVAAMADQALPSLPLESQLLPLARRCGFDDARLCSPLIIPVSSRIRRYCLEGCPRHGRSLTCPPHSPDITWMMELRERCRHAVVVVGTPPLRDFQYRLLKLEEKLQSLSGGELHTLTAGPCALCEHCTPEACPKPALRRFSLEACGVDVYTLCRTLGIELGPVTGNYINYIGVILCE
ncbi:MAG: methyltransferase domain-containing protein [Lentisphaerae bacterium]|nr:MAG: methyltransferase domain-containing protein [Lentisphaerota bacterium]